ncbi:MAG: C25 family cysteine peptidase, partial [Myxococcota bacterium]
SHWMWQFILAGSDDAVFSSTFDAPNVAQAEAEIELAVRGGSQSRVYPDHQIDVRLNGTRLGVRGFFGFDDVRLRFPVPAGLLQTSGNVFEVESMQRDGVSFSVEWIDRFTVRYRKEATAENDIAFLSASGEGSVRVNGFSSSQLEVWRLSSGRAQSALDGLPLDQSSGSIAVTIPTGGIGEYVAFVPGSVPEILALTPLNGIDVRGETEGAEYVVITHPALIEGARELARYRETQGLSTRVFDVFDLYDSFSRGTEDPEALRLFVKDAYERWETRPRYVVLIGDGTFDSRNAAGTNDNLIRPPLIATRDATFASDSTLGDVVAGRGYEISVGRIPATALSEVQRYVSKVRAFERAGDSLGAQRAMVLADNPDDGGDFDRSLELAVSAFESGFSVESVSVDPEDIQVARDRVFAALDDGTRYLHFIGHGGLTGLAAEGILTRDDVSSLTNSRSPMVLLAAACLLGRFDLPGAKSVSEALLLDRYSGAAAVYASAGIESNEQSTAIARSVADVLSANRHRRIGAVIAEASALSSAVGLSYEALALHTLQGDPALVVAAGADEWRDPVAADAPPPSENDRLETPLDTPSLPDGPRRSGCGATPVSFWVIALTLAGFRRRRRG